MKVAVIGANGQLGTDVSEEFVRNGDDVCRLTHSYIDIESPESVRRTMADVNPGMIVNTAAMHHVEHCEQDPLKARAVNALGALNLAVTARELGAVLVHVSTDYVFDGLKRKPYLEDDATAPLNVYGNTKLEGESFIRAETEKYFILRTSALYGRHPCRAKGRNFVELMLKLAKERDELRVVDDEIVSPTSTIELAKQIFLLSRSDEFGLYHASSEGSCTWHEFARKIFDIANVKVNLTIARPDEFPSKVPRPKYSVLENRKLTALGINSFRTWEDGLYSYLLSAQRTN